LNLDDNATIESIKGKKTLKHGLFSYPVLQAADILLYGTTHVPVGDDQRQHLEFTRECVTNFNFTYKTKCLVAPETLLSPAHRVMSLTDPRKKMSKSDTVTKSRLHIHSSPKKISQRISGAVTDSRNEVTYDPELRPGVANLINILAGFDRQGRTPEALAEQMQGYKIAQLKEVVTQVLSDELAEVRERYKYYESNRDEMREISAQGTEKARQHAEKTMAKVRDAIGISD
jgi:tryptophanyl-tRNA synthetase